MQISQMLDIPLETVPDVVRRKIHRLAISVILATNSKCETSQLFSRKLPKYYCNWSGGLEYPLICCHRVLGSL